MLIGQKAEYDVPISPIDPSIEEVGIFCIVFLIAILVPR